MDARSFICLVTKHKRPNTKDQSSLCYILDTLAARHGVNVEIGVIFLFLSLDQVLLGSLGWPGTLCVD